MFNAPHLFHIALDFVIAKLRLVLDTTKKQLRKDITRGHFGQGHFGHFRFRKRGHLLTIIKYIYFIIVAVLTASVFDFDQMTNDQMTRQLYFPRKS